LPEDEHLQLVQSAIRLSAHVLARDSRQLAGHLVGRLFGNMAPVIQALVKQAAEGKTWPWFRPLNRSLTASGGPLIRTLEGHMDELNAVAVTPDVAVPSRAQTVKPPPPAKKKTVPPQPDEPPVSDEERAQTSAKLKEFIETLRASR